MATGLTVAVAKEIFEAITKYLGEKKAKPEEKADFKKNLHKLVELSSTSSEVIRGYLALYSESTETSDRCTELISLLKVTPPVDLKNQFDTFIKKGIQHDLQDGIEAIREYTKDYTDALGYYNRVNQYAQDAKAKLETNRNLSCDKMEEVNEQLDKLTRIGKNKVEDVLKELQKSYKVLEQI